MNTEDQIKLGDYPAAGQTIIVDGIAHVIMPNNCALQDMEKYQAQPRRIRAHIRFDEVKSFVGYVDTFKDSAATALFGKVLETGVTVSAILDYPTKDATAWGSHRATFASQFSREWMRWHTQNDEAMTQEEFLEFVEENVQTFRTPSGSDLLSIARDLDLKQEVQWKGSKRLDTGDTALSFVSTTKTGGAGDIELPKEVTLALPVFQGGDSYIFTARLRPKLENESLTLRFVLVNPAAIVDQAARNCIATVETELGTDVLMGDVPPSV